MDERKDQLTGRSHLVRLYEANAAIQFPTDDDLRFRSALANSLTKELQLVVGRNVPAPATTPQRPARP